MDSDGPGAAARAAARAPAEPLHTRGVAVGVVKWWRDDRGYGAVASAATAPWDVWCQFAAVATPGFKALTRG